MNSERWSAGPGEAPLAVLSPPHVPPPTLAGRTAGDLEPWPRAGSLAGTAAAEGASNTELATRKKVTPPKCVGPAVELDSLYGASRVPGRLPPWPPFVSPCALFPPPQTPSFLGSFLSLQSTNLSNFSQPVPLFQFLFSPPQLLPHYPSLLFLPPLSASGPGMAGDNLAEARRGAGGRVSHPGARTSPAPAPCSRPSLRSAPAAPGRTAPSQESRRLTVATATPVAPLSPSPAHASAPLPSHPRPRL